MTDIYDSVGSKIEQSSFERIDSKPTESPAPDLTASNSVPERLTELGKPVSHEGVQKISERLSEEQPPPSSNLQAQHKITTDVLAQSPPQIASTKELKARIKEADKGTPNPHNMTYGRHLLNQFEKTATRVLTAPLKFGSALFFAGTSMSYGAIGAISWLGSKAFNSPGAESFGKTALIKAYQEGLYSTAMLTGATLGPVKDAVDLISVGFTNKEIVGSTGASKNAKTFITDRLLDSVDSDPKRTPLENKFMDITWKITKFANFLSGSYLHPTYSGHYRGLTFSLIKDTSPVKLNKTREGLFGLFRETQAGKAARATKKQELERTRLSKIPTKSLLDANYMAQKTKLVEDLDSLIAGLPEGPSPIKKLRNYIKSMGPQFNETQKKILENIESYRNSRKSPDSWSDDLRSAARSLSTGMLNPEEILTWSNRLVRHNVDEA